MEKCFFKDINWCTYKDCPCNYIVPQNCPYFCADVQRVNRDNFDATNIELFDDNDLIDYNYD